MGRFFMDLILFTFLRLLFLAYSQTSVIYLDPSSDNPVSDGSKASPFKDLSSCFLSSKDTGILYHVQVLGNLTINSALRLESRRMILNKSDDAKDRISLEFSAEGSLTVVGCEIFKLINFSFQLGKNLSSKLFFIGSVNSNLYLELVIIKDQELHSANSALISGIDSTLSILSCSFEGLTIRKSSLIKTSGFLERSDTRIENSIFLKINQDAADLPLIALSEYNSSILLRNCSVILNNASHSLISLLNLKRYITIENCLFSENWVGVASVRVESAYGLNFSLSAFKRMNKQNASNLTAGGCALFVQNAIELYFYKFSVEDSYSDLTAVGVKIIDDSRLTAVFGAGATAPKQTIHFNESSFLKNFVFYDSPNQVGCALLIISDAAIIIQNSTFFQNFMNSTEDTKFKAGSPCLNSLSIKNNVTIIFSHFIENKSRFLGNCLLVYGHSLFINATYFIKNYPIVSARIWAQYMNNEGSPRSIMVSHGETGGALFSLCNRLSISKSIFSGSGGYTGGAIFVGVSSGGDGSLLLRFEEVLFDANEGGIVGGHLFIHTTMAKMDALINNCYFNSGDADNGGVMGLYFKCKDCYFTVNNSVFARNMATQGAGIDIATEDGYIFVNNSIILNHTALNPKIKLGTGSVFRFGVNPKAYFGCYRNIYINNYGAARGELAARVIKYYESESVHLYPTAPEGAISTVVMSSYLEFNNCIFIKSQATNNAGCFIVLESSVIVIKNSFFDGCRAKRNGGIFLGMERIIIILQNTSFKYNEADAGTIFAGQENIGNISKVELTNCSISENSAGNEIFSITDTNLFITNCSISTQQASVVFGIRSFIIVKDSNLANITCFILREGCVFGVQDNTFLSIERVNISNVYSKLSGGGISSDNSTVQIQHLSTKNITVENYGSIIYSFLSPISLQFSRFSENGPNALHLRNTSISAEGCFFLNSNLSPANGFAKNNHYGTVYIESPNGTCLFRNTSFIGNKNAVSGGAVFIYNTDDDYLPEASRSGVFVIIQLCLFLQNSVTNEGGAIYSWKQNLLVEDSVFEANSANSGGALFLDSDNENLTRSITIKTSVFSDNTAEFDGGAIKWLGRMPELSSLNFSQGKPNKAVYGDRIASFPVHFRMIVNKIITENKTERVELLYTGEEKNDLFTLEDVVSGGVLDIELHFELLDIYNQRVSTLNEGTVEIDFLEQEYLASQGYSDWNRSGYTHIKKTSNILQGRASFSKISLIVRPPANVILKVYSTEIKSFFATTLGNLTRFRNILNIKNSYNYLLRVSVRPCVIGEIFLEESNSCYFCPIGKFTLTGPYEGGNCNSCLPNVDCKGGDFMQLKKGYWRSSNKSRIIHECTRNKDFCEGGYSSLCTAGYSGPICGGCSTSGPVKYSRISNYCVECLEKSLNETRVAFAFLGFILVMGILVLSAVSDASKLNEDQSLTMQKCFSIYLKIFMNYIQINSIITSLPLRLPDYIKNYTNIQANTGNIPSQVISIECLVLERNIETHPVYFRALAASLLPFLLILIFQGVLLVLWIAKRRSQITNMIINFHVISIFLQPTVIQELTDLITCQEVDPGKFYMTKEMNIECYTIEHQRWSLGLVFPALFYWVLLYPMGTLYLLKKEKLQLSEIEIRKRMGFYLTGFKNKFYYWEFMTMYRKVLVLFITTILDIPVFVKITCLLALNALYFFSIFKYRPFVIKDLNDMELNSNFSTLCTGYFGLMYLAIDNEFSKGILFLILLAVNLNFLLSWMKSLLIIFLSSQSEKIYSLCPRFVEKVLSLSDSFSNKMKSLRSGRSFQYQCKDSSPTRIYHKESNFTYEER